MSSELEARWEQCVGVAPPPDGQPDEIDLARAALVVAQTEYPDLNIEQHLDHLDSLAAGARVQIGEEREPLYAINRLSSYLFEEVGFQGNQEQYYDPDNSCLNVVLNRKLGIPITLSLIYIEVGRRLGIPLVGIGLPGHFLVRHREITDLYIDTFYGGLLLNKAECIQRLRQMQGYHWTWDDHLLNPVTSRELLGRLIRNLKAIYTNRQDFPHAVLLMSLLLTLQPAAAEEHRDRGLAYFQMGEIQSALQDLEAYVAAAPQARDSWSIRTLAQQLALMVKK